MSQIISDLFIHIQSHKVHLTLLSHVSLLLFKVEMLTVDIWSFSTNEMRLYRTHITK